MMMTVGRRSRDLNHCRVTIQRLFSKIFQIASNVQERCLIVGRRSRDLRSLSRDSGYFLPCLFRTAFAYASVCCLSRYYYSSFRQKQGHVSPPRGMVRSWKFRHHIKARDRTKRISDFGGKIPTRCFPMRGTSSPL